MQTIGKFLIITGIILVFGGIILWFFGNKLTWLGNLPGDIKVEKENFRFYFPITTMIIVSVALTLMIWLVRRFL